MAADGGESMHVMVLSNMLQQQQQQGESSDAKDKCERTGEGGGSSSRKEFNFWTDQEVWLLLDAYEDKWNQLDRGNVKSKHWEEIAGRLAAANLHTGGAWAAKTPTQCKNKIEDMKKKFRAEKAMLKSSPSAYSKWVFFQRMEAMLRNGLRGGMDNGEHTLEMDSFAHHLVHDQGGEEVDTSFTTPQQHQPQQQQQQQHLHGSRREHVNVNMNGGLTGLLMRDEAAAPSSKRRKGGSGGGGVSEVVAVVKAFGESLLRIEEAQIQMQREVVRMNAEAELRRIEMEVKRTEMMLNTQLQIAKLFSGKVAAAAATRKKKGVKKAENGGAAAAAAAALQENGIEDE